MVHQCQVCGKLGTFHPELSSQSMKITLVAKPDVPQEIVENTAKSIKYSEIYELKLNEYLAQAKKRGQKDKGGKKEKNKKDKAKDSLKAGDKKKKKDSAEKEDEIKGKDKAEDKPDIVITEKELEYDYLDLYPAEMVYWRSMEPYYIHADFTCLIDYEHMRKKRDKIYLSAICKVIRPDFSTNLNLQRIDFGICPIGMNTTKNIMLQNIMYKNIKPKVSVLNPMGCFSVPHIRNLTLPPEHYLRLPVDFRPTTTETVTEYFEIRSNATIMPLILCGEGVLPIINVSPQFTVFRFETKQQKLAELQLKIDNSSEVAAKVQFDKLFEIGALLTDITDTKAEKVEENVQTDEDKGGKSKAKKEKPTKEKKSKDKEKTAKYSDNLTDKELEAIERCFSKIKGESHFDLKTTETHIDILPNTSHALTILCGDPESIKKKKLEGPKKAKKGDKKADKKSEASNGIADNKKINEDTQYITQYNVNVGQTFVKSIILICTIKS